MHYRKATPHSKCNCLSFCEISKDLRLKSDDDTPNAFYGRAVFPLFSITIEHSRYKPIEYRYILGLPMAFNAIFVYFCLPQPKPICMCHWKMMIGW